MSRFWFSLDVFVEFMDSVTKIELFVVAVKWLEPASGTHAKDRIFKLSPLSLNWNIVERNHCRGITGYIDHYQGLGQAIRLTAALINIHEPLI